MGEWILIGVLFVCFAIINRWAHQRDLTAAKRLLEIEPEGPPKKAMGPLMGQDVQLHPCGCVGERAHSRWSRTGGKTLP